MLLICIIYSRHLGANPQSAHCDYVVVLKQYSQVYSNMSTFPRYSRDLYDGNVYLGIDPELQLAFPQDEWEDEQLFNLYMAQRANQSQSPDRGADVFGSDSETTHVSETDDDEPLSPEIPIKHTPVKPPPPPVKPAPPVPGPVLTRRVRKRNLPKPVVSKEARIALDERRRRRRIKIKIKFSILRFQIPSSQNTGQINSPLTPY